VETGFLILEICIENNEIKMISGSSVITTEMEMQKLHTNFKSQNLYICI
jgi:hypothetical protein